MDELQEELLGGNSTEKGEFVCSYYQWLPIEEQRKKAKELEDMTRNITPE